MKTKIAVVTLLIGLLVSIGFLASKQKVAARFWAVDKPKPIKSFEEYSQINSREERIATIKKETPENKSNFWRQNLIYQAQHLELTQEQEAWVKDAYNFLDENFFAAAGGDETEFIKTDLGKAYENLMLRRGKLFTKEQSRKFCSVIGGDSVINNSVKETKAELDGHYCNCVASLCPQCPDDEVCNNGNCLTISDSCGCFAVWTCTKKCTVGLP